MIERRIPPSRCCVGVPARLGRNNDTTKAFARPCAVGFLSAAHSAWTLRTAVTSVTSASKAAD